MLTIKIKENRHFERRSFVREFKTNFPLIFTLSLQVVDLELSCTINCTAYTGNLRSRYFYFITILILFPEENNNIFMLIFCDVMIFNVYKSSHSSQFFRTEMFIKYFIKHA